ncbi:UvrD-helicase domain-containing protein [Clavibacter zhangzhiyongii]|uniref:UvrD-helicase domain-containing protein n=1 Tax=Clavibacter zhangzhiyongii TaxID=2768071 RepID=UPI0039A50EF2
MRTPAATTTKGRHYRQRGTPILLSRLHLDRHQAAALAPEVFLIEACPGAGKTRAIVERYRLRAERKHQGIALVSFTNAAVDEVSLRCSSTPEAMQAPHFVGTIDTFLHRYIVTPYDTARLSVAPRYLQSWSELPTGASSLKVGSTQYATMPLSDFAHDSSGTIQLLPAGLSNRYFRQATGPQQADVQTRGAARIRKLNDTGLYDSDSARYRALQILRDASSATLRSALSARFAEIIVDEFQDCAAIEHELIAELRAIGIHVVVVADPDQAIFGFRHSEERLYEDFRGRLKDSQIVKLNKNYRSTVAICSLVSSLRHHGRGEIESTRNISEERNPSCIYLLAGDERSIQARFIELADQWQIPHGQRYSLAHKSAEAKSQASGGEPSLKRSLAFTTNLLRELQS